MRLIKVLIIFIAGITFVQSMAFANLNKAKAIERFVSAEQSYKKGDFKQAIFRI